MTANVAPPDPSRQRTLNASLDAAKKAGSITEVHSVEFGSRYLFSNLLVFRRTVDCAKPRIIAEAH